MDSKGQNLYFYRNLEVLMCYGSIWDQKNPKTKVGDLRLVWAMKPLEGTSHPCNTSRKCFYDRISTTLENSGEMVALKCCKKKKWHFQVKWDDANMTAFCLLHETFLIIPFGKNEKLLSTKVAAFTLFTRNPPKIYSLKRIHVWT